MDDIDNEIRNALIESNKALSPSSNFTDKVMENVVMHEEKVKGLTTFKPLFPKRLVRIVLYGFVAIVLYSSFESSESNSSISIQWIKNIDFTYLQNPFLAVAGVSLVVLLVLEKWLLSRFTKQF